MLHIILGLLLTNPAREETANSRVKRSRDKSPRTQLFDTSRHHSMVTPSQEPDAMCFTCVGLLLCPEVFDLFLPSQKSSRRIIMFRSRSRRPVRIPTLIARITLTASVAIVVGAGIANAQPTQPQQGQPTQVAQQQPQPVVSQQQSTQPQPQVQQNQPLSQPASRQRQWQYRDNSDDSDCSTDDCYVSQHSRSADKSDPGSSGIALRACHRLAHPKSHATTVRFCRS
jgi:hypothetical protein